MNPDTTVFIPVPVSESPEETKAVIFLQKDGSRPYQLVYHVPDNPINEIWKDKYTHWLKPVKLSEITTSQPLQGTASDLLDKISIEKGEQPVKSNEDMLNDLRLISHELATVNFSNHSNMKFAIKSALSIADGAIQKHESNASQDGWLPIETAPKNGTVIEINYGTPENPEDVCQAVWSERPVCMLGNRNGGFPPGWATPYGGDTDSNLPLDPPKYWRKI